MAAADILPTLLAPLPARILTDSRIAGVFTVAPRADGASLVTFERRGGRTAASMRVGALAALPVLRAAGYVVELEEGEEGLGLVVREGVPMAAIYARGRASEARRASTPSAAPNAKMAGGVERRAAWKAEQRPAVDGDALLARVEAGEVDEGQLREALARVPANAEVRVAIARVLRARAAARAAA
jgi:hypothetical protein